MIGKKNICHKTKYTWNCMACKINILSINLHDLFAIVISIYLIISFNLVQTVALLMIESELTFRNRTSFTIGLISFISLTIYNDFSKNSIQFQ